MMPQSTTSAFCLLPSAFAERLDVFPGAASPAEAHIYARLKLSDDEVAAGCRLVGRIVGPGCAFSQTLPARMPMMDRSAGNTLLLEAVVPDPCFWTPELPFLYRAQIELRRGGETIAKCERTIGVRRFGVRDRWLNFEGKRFVLRGVRRKANDRMQNEAAFCHETWTAMVVSNPDDEFCEFASRNGMLLIAECRSQPESAAQRDVACELRRLAQWPAVAIAIVDRDADLPANVAAVTHNLLLGQRIGVEETLDAIEWAQVVFAEVVDPRQFENKIEGCNLPVVAVRPRSESIAIDFARGACDKLQSELAPHGDFAGYIVWERDS
jgi:hypothetical protein